MFTLRRQRWKQKGFCEFEACLVYIASSRLLRKILRKRKERKEKQKNRLDRMLETGPLCLVGLKQGKNEQEMLVSELPQWTLILEYQPNEEAQILDQRGF